MDLVYLRYNPTKDGKEPKKLKDIENRLKKDGKVIKQPVKNTSRLSNKEINYLEELVKKFDVKKLSLFYVKDDEQFYKLKEKLSTIKVKIVDNEEININSKIISKKLLILIDVLKFIAKQKIVSKDELYNKLKELNLLHKTEALNITNTTIRNYIKDLEELYFIDVSNQNYKIKDTETILNEIFEKIDDVKYITQILSSMSDENMKNLSESTKKLLNFNNEFVTYKQRPFEDLEEVAFDFEQFKLAIRYKKIISYIKKGNGKIDKNIIPVRLVFMENNWYFIGLVKEDLRMYRLNFIDDFELSKETHNKDLTKYIEFIINDMKTPFTKFNKPLLTAKLSIDKEFKHYFKVKEHFPYQKKLDDEEDLIIEVRYTQSKEILPVIKKWLPHIKIIESKNNSLQKELKRELEKALSYLA